MKKALADVESVGRVVRIGNPTSGRAA